MEKEIKNKEKIKNNQEIKNTEKEVQEKIKTLEVNKKDSEIKKNNKSVTGKIGSILSILSVIALIYSIVATFSFILVLIFYAVVAIIIVVTLLTILLQEGFQDLISSSEAIAQFSVDLLNTAPYAIGTSVGLAILSILMLLPDKKYAKRKSGIILDIVILSICTAVVLFILVAPEIIV